MTSVESNHIWSTHRAVDLEQKMILQISGIFRLEHDSERAIPKHVSRKTGLSPNTIKKWKNGLHPPRLGHFLLLLIHYPDILNFLHELIRSNVSAENEKRSIQSLLPTIKTHVPIKRKVYRAKYCTINLSLPQRIARELNQRQLWFLAVLQQGERKKADYIAATWEVSDRIARYDIEILVKKGLIRFKGAKKNGWYEIV